MSITFSWGPTSLVRTISGAVSGDELFQSNLEIHSDARFLDIDYIINDFTKVTSHQVTLYHTEAYARTDEMVARTKHNLKIALVIPDEPLLELASNYCALMENQLYECEIFATIDDARIWCDLS